MLRFRRKTGLSHRARVRFAGIQFSLSVIFNNLFRFHKLVWSSWGHADELDKSLIAGGCDAGRIVFYNTAKLLKNETGYVTCTDKHTGPVKALEFNPFQVLISVNITILSTKMNNLNTRMLFAQRNLLASGAAQSQLFIWDVNNLSAPMSPQDDGTYTHPTDDIMSLAWHKQGPEGWQINQRMLIYSRSLKLINIVVLQFSIS